MEAAVVGVEEVCCVVASFIFDLILFVLCLLLGRSFGGGDDDGEFGGGDGDSFGGGRGELYDHVSFPLFHASNDHLNML